MVEGGPTLRRSGVSVAKLDDGGTVAALVGGSGAVAGDRRMTVEMLSYGTAQAPCPVPVHDSRLPATVAQRAVEMNLDGGDRLLDGETEQHQLLGCRLLG